MGKGESIQHQVSSGRLYRSPRLCLVSWLERETAFDPWSSCSRSLCTCIEFSGDHKSIPQLSDSIMCKLIETFMTHGECMTVDFCCYCLCELMTFLTICVTRPCLIRCAQWTINGLLPHMFLTRCHPVVCCAFIQMLGLYFALLIHSYPCRMCVSVYNVCILVCPCVNVCESIESTWDWHWVPSAFFF